MTKLLDCTIRDGGFHSDFYFSDEIINKYINSVDNSPIDIVEIGFISNAFTHYGNLTPALCSKFYNKNFKTTIMLDMNIVPTDISHISKANYNVDIIRISTPNDKINKAHKIAEMMKKRGYMTTFNRFYTSLLTVSELENLLKDFPFELYDVFYIPDTRGIAALDTINSFKEKIEYLKDKVNIGIHLHNNHNFATELSLELIKDGKIAWADSCINGLGRGCGNAKTEVILYRLFKDLSLFKLSLMPEFNKSVYSLFFELCSDFDVRSTEVAEMIKKGNIDALEKKIK